MSLPSRNWPAVLNTSENDLIQDFFEPALELATGYDRGVGFFSSGWFRVAAKGMLAFADHAGKARWVTSPILTVPDWEALRSGDEARTDAALKAAILRNIGDLRTGLDKNVLSAIAWMVADGILTFKLAVPRGKLEQGEFHDKFGIFRDAEDHRLSFNGSYNDSLQGLLNYESIKVFRSWDPPMASLVDADEDRFERLWKNDDPNVRVCDLQAAAREQLLKLREGERPYARPPWITEVAIREPVAEAGPGHFVIPEGYTAHDFQKRAMRAWLDKEGRGILAMATGTGKTFTALSLAQKVAESVKPLILIVVCPYINLARQWEREMRRFGIRPIPCYLSRARWFDLLQIDITHVVAGTQHLLPLVVTNRTFLNPAFQRLLPLDRVKHLLVADEVHNLGAEHLKLKLDGRIAYRLGLSATPERHADEEGTKTLMDYFGGVVFEYSIKEAIKDGVLCPYEYHPVLVTLTDDEIEQYWTLSREIARYANRKLDEGGIQSLKALLLRRARLLGAAANKLPALTQVLQSLENRLDRALVYCGDGRVEAEANSDEETTRQVEAAVRRLGWDHKLRVRKFTCEESMDEREIILAELREGLLDAAVAIRCLDEGIDVPDIRMAFLLASSTNPRQFIQRRGRLLRKAPGKSRAWIWDFIVRPPDDPAGLDEVTFNCERRLVSRELERALEFCESAANGDAALNSLLDLRHRYNLLHK